MSFPLNLRLIMPIGPYQRPAACTLCLSKQFRAVLLGRGSFLLYECSLLSLVQPKRRRCTRLDRDQSRQRQQCESARGTTHFPPRSFKRIEEIMSKAAKETADLLLAPEVGGSGEP